MKTVVIGAGQSGAWVARTVREHMPDAEVALIGEEALAPYERPPLSKSILAGSESEPAYLLSVEQAQLAGIDLRLGIRATGIDRHCKVVSLSSGDHISYDKLVIATGGRGTQIDDPALHLDLMATQILRAGSSLRLSRTNIKSAFVKGAFDQTALLNKAIRQGRVAMGTLVIRGEDFAVQVVEANFLPIDLYG
jgi:NADPH-dependent 2,4-dienoyl-CoA reductase/sulfur reductase-like enzyme